jgi:hypothetical protein
LSLELFARGEERERELMVVGGWVAAAVV